MITYQTALVLGAGRSGLAAERLLKSEGTKVWLAAEESMNLKQLKGILEEKPEICILSPGFALDHPWVETIRSADIPLLAELELGWSRHTGKTVAITGSNGKSTAAKLLYDILQKEGFSASIGGNYGIPASEMILNKSNNDWLVLEVSSFQLETTQHFRAEIAILLNILPNHLNRHGSMEVYRQTKMHLFANATPSDCSILPTSESSIRIKGNILTFGEEGDYSFKDGYIHYQEKAVANLSNTPFNNPILGPCTGAAITAAAQTCGCSAESIAKAAKEYIALPHRQEKVGEINGVTYINDSKATNLAAVKAALNAHGKHIHLIAGGLPKESNYNFLKEVLAERVRSIYLIGQASQAMSNAWKGTCYCVECETLQEAVEQANKHAIRGESVLFSPGCASFDQFKNFEERGKAFTQLVQCLAKQQQ